MDLDRLFERPIAHRGLHDRRQGVIENSRTAVWHALQAGYGFEVDVQMSADGEAMVFHDETLDRLTEYAGPVKDLTAAQLCGITLRENAEGDTIWTLAELIERVAGQVPAVIEIKTLWDRDLRLARRVGELLSSYDGPIAAKSFDPDIVAHLARNAPNVARGIVGYGFAFWLLALTLRVLPTGIVYATWSGLGIVLIALVAWLWYGQRLVSSIAR